MNPVPFTVGTADAADGIDDTVPSCVVALDVGSGDTDGAKDNVGAFVGSGETDGAVDIDGNDDVIDALFVSFVENNDGLGDTYGAFSGDNVILYVKFADGIATIVGISDTDGTVEIDGMADNDGAFDNVDREGTKS